MTIRKFLTGAMCAGLLAGGAAWSGRALAQGSMTVEQPSNVPEAEQRQVTLKVISTDPAAHKATFEAQVRPEANITENGRPIRLDNLKPGDEVRASFDPNSGEVIKMQVIKK